MKLLALLQTKALVTLVAGVLLVGGAAAAFAATPAGQHVVQSLTHAHPTVTAAATHSAQGNAQGATGTDHASCPGQADAQNLATKYQLSTASTGTAVTAMCALHQGTFKGTTTGGVSVTASRVYGYGEIDQLLTYAQYLAAHDRGNVAGQLVYVHQYMNAGALPSIACAGRLPQVVGLRVLLPGTHAQRLLLFITKAIGCPKLIK